MAVKGNICRFLGPLLLFMPVVKALAGIPVLAPYLSWIYLVPDSIMNSCTVSGAAIGAQGYPLVTTSKIATKLEPIKKAAK